MTPDARTRGARLAAAALLALAACGKAPEGGTGGVPRKSVIQIKGSDTMVNVAQAWAEAYKNVNPDVAHPRHSQAFEARLPSLFRNLRTQPFNGYGDQVARLYAGMDLKKNY